MRREIVGPVQLVYPQLRVELPRDSLVVWVRWVSSEQPPSPHEPAAQGVRVELLLNRVLAWERVALNAPGLEAYERPVWSVVQLDRDIAPGSPVRLEGVGDPFSALGSLAIEIGVAAR